MATAKSVFDQLKGERRGGALSSFMVCPAGWHFETQEPHEKIILLLRQHPIVLLGWSIVVAALAAIPAFWDILPVRELPGRFQIMTLLLWYFLVAALAVEKFLDWYFNVYIVTDERVVDIDFFGLIYRDMTVAKINQIQDVNFKASGGLSAIFDYGDVFIQTAAEKREFDFDRVPNPARVVEILYMLMQEEELEAIEGRVR